MSNDEINVSYDNTTGIPSNTLRDSESDYKVKISPYFYTKLNTIDNNNTFTNQEISNYNLNVNNNKIDISTTKKLINYLISLLKSNVEKLNTKIDETYVVDNELKSNSNNPVKNSVLYNKFNELVSLIGTKSNNGHVHSINDVTSLNNNLNNLSTTKADKTALNNHINNKDNPHNVTPQQLGLSNSLTEVQSFTHSCGVKVSVYANAFLVHVVVTGDATNISVNDSFLLQPTRTGEVVTIKNGYRPPFTYVIAPATTNLSPRNENWTMDKSKSKIAINTRGDVYILNTTDDNKLSNIRTCFTYPRI